MQIETLLRKIRLKNHNQKDDRRLIKEVVKLLKENDNNAFSLITLFGLSAEELLEAGADYEDVVKMGCMLK